MAIEHVALPIAAVQFHPESVMTGAGAIGLPIIHAALALGDTNLPLAMTGSAARWGS
jgi:anthranilate synthase